MLLIVIIIGFCLIFYVIKNGNKKSQKTLDEILKLKRKESGKEQK